MANNSTTDKVLKGVSTQTIISILIGIVEIGAFSIMSRLLSRQDFGYYAAITAITTIFAAFSDAGIGSAIVQKKDLNQRYLNNAFTLCLLFGLFGSSLMLIFSGTAARYVADDSMTLPLMLVSITLLTNTLSSVNFSIMHRKLQFLRMGLIRLSALIFTTGISIILAIKGFGYYAILAKIILNSLIILVVSYFAAHTKYRFAFEFDVYKEIFGFGGWLMASVFFRKIADQIDRLMMSSLFGLQTLGMYSRPKEFINSMTGRITDIFDSALFPVLSSFQDEKVRVQESYKSTLYYLNIVGLMMSLFYMFNSELIIRIFLGAEWMNVNNLFILLSTSGLLMMNGSLGDIYLRSLAFTKQQFFLRILQAFSTIVLVLIASRLGVLAVAFAYLLSYCIVVLVKMMFISKKIDFGFVNSLIMIFKSSRIAFYYVPAYVLCMFFIPNTVGGNIFKFVIFCTISILIFIVFPVCVGKRYKVEMYGNVIRVVRKWIRR